MNKNRFLDQNWSSNTMNRSERSYREGNSNGVLCIDLCFVHLLYGDL